MVFDVINIFSTFKCSRYRTTFLDHIIKTVLCTHDLRTRKRVCGN